MTDRPIIFSAPMVRALLDGRKTQTRRVLKPQPVCYQNPPSFSWGKFVGEWPDDWFGYGNAIDGALPYAPGGRLWVKEAHAFDIEANTVDEREIIWYRATQPVDEVHWRSPIHMPRWASRLTLIVTDVRVQRLAEISEEDARAEGATSRPACNGFMSRYDGWSMDWSPVGTLSAYSMSAKPGGPAKVPLTESDISLYTAASAFANYWDTIHGPGSWTANPWVCALTFDVLRCNIDDAGA